MPRYRAPSCCFGSGGRERSGKTAGVYSVKEVGQKYIRKRRGRRKEYLYYCPGCDEGMYLLERMEMRMPDGSEDIEPERLTGEEKRKCGMRKWRTIGHG